MYFNFFSSILCTFLRKRVVSNWSQFINSNSFTLVYPDLLGWSISWQLVTWQNKRNLATKKISLQLQTVICLSWLFNTFNHIRLLIVVIRFLIMIIGLYVSVSLAWYPMYLSPTSEMGYCLASSSDSKTMLMEGIGPCLHTHKHWPERQKYTIVSTG